MPENDLSARLLCMYSLADIGLMIINSGATVIGISVILWILMLFGTIINDIVKGIDDYLRNKKFNKWYPQSFYDIGLYIFALGMGIFGIGFILYTIDYIFYN